MTSGPCIPTGPPRGRTADRTLVTPWDDQVQDNVDEAGRRDCSACVSLCTEPQVCLQAALCFLAVLLDHTYILCPDGHKLVIMTLECTEETIPSEHVTTVKTSAFHSEY